MQANRPNLLFIHAHDMGRENSCYRRQPRTPHMEAIARSGTLFHDAHCAAPTCSPSRAALLTGQTAHQVGMLGLAHRGFDLDNYDHHLAAYVRSHGYRTLLCGVQHEFAHEREQELYDEVHARPNPPSAVTDRQAAEAATQCIRKNEDHPWFMWLGFFLPHRPFLKASNNAPLPHGPETLPDLVNLRREQADFHVSIEHTDAMIGRVLAALREAGQMDNTIMVLTTDHGPPFPGMKCNLTGQGTGVTLAIKPPGTSRPMDSRALVSHLDVFPTVCDWADLPKPDWLVGHSLRPHMEGREAEPRQNLFAEMNIHACLDPMRSVRTTAYNYIHLFGPHLRQPVANIDPGEGKTWWLQSSLSQTDRARHQLYDLRNDPAELQNLARLPEYQSVFREMKALLVKWMRDTDDPLLNGSLYLPVTAAVSSFDALDAGSGPFLRHHGKFDDLIVLNK